MLCLDKGAAERLANQVNEAVNLLTNYNARLSKEMEQRKNVASMLRDFLQAQKDLLEQAEHRLEVSKNSFILLIFTTRNQLLYCCIELFAISPLF